MDAAGPEVRGIALNDPPQELNGVPTFFADDVIRITVTFSEAVTVDTAGGTPRWPYSIIGGDRFSQSARYAGKAGPARLVFESTVPANPNVQVPDMSVGHNVSLRGGAIRDALGNAHVEGTQPGVALFGPAVDGSRQGGADRMGPLMRSLAFAGAAPRDADGDGTAETYWAGDAVEVAVTFGEAVEVDTSGGTPWLGVQVGTVERQAAYASGTGTATLVFSYTVAAGDEDSDGVSVPAGSITLGGGTLADASGNAAALAHDALAPDAARRVDGPPAVVTGLAFAGVAPYDADGDEAPETYRAGDAIEVAVTFSRAVEVDTSGGTPWLGVQVGTVERQAAYASGTGTATLVFSYTVAAGETDGDGASVPAGAIARNGGTMADAAGNAVALAHDALDADAARTVDATIVPAAVTGLAFAGLATRDTDGDDVAETYVAGDAIEIEAAFSRAVTVDTAGGRPTLALGVGSETRDAVYASGSGTATLRFSYPVVAGDEDTDGVAVPEGAIVLAGGAIGDASGAAALAHPALAPAADRRVDAAGPVLTHRSINDAPQKVNDVPTFFAGDVIEFTATFTEPVTVDTAGGVPQAPFGLFRIGRAGLLDKSAAYVGKLGAGRLLFRYEVQAGDQTTLGIDAHHSPPRVEPNGGTIADALGNGYIPGNSQCCVYISYAHVDGSQTGSADHVRPVVQGLAFAGAAIYDADSNGMPETYGSGQAIEVAVTFSKAVTVDTSDGTPTLALEVGEETVQAAYASGTGTATLTFAYTVAPDDEDTDGVSVPAGSITLAGGTIADAADNAAALAYDALAADAARKVDGTVTSARVTGLALADAAPHDADRDGTPDTYKAGDDVEVAVTFSGAVTVDTSGGTPTLALEVGEETVQAAYASGTGTATLTFAYTVAAGDLDADGVSVPAGLIAPAGGAIGDAAGAAALAHAGLAGDAAHRVDAVRPTIEAIRVTNPSVLEAGDVLRYRLEFSEPVFSTGSGEFQLTLVKDGPNLTRSAVYAGRLDDRTLAFDYTVASSDSATQILLDTMLPLSNGRIVDAVGHEYRVSEAVHTLSVTVDGSTQGADSVAPVVGSIAFAGAAPHDVNGDGDGDTYRQGDAVEVAVTFSEAVTVDTTGGTPTLALDVGGVTRAAAYASGTGTATLVFSYSVAAEDSDTDGVRVPAGSIALAGGMLADAAGNAAALAHDAIAPDAARKVDGTATPPSLTGLAFAKAAPRDANRDGAGDTYGENDLIEVEATFDSAVTVDTAAGAPTLVLAVGANEREAAYASGSGTTTLVFAYPVAAGDEDADGVSVPAGSIALGGGAIGDATGPAVLAHAGLAADPARRVDAAGPEVRGVALNDPPQELNGVPTFFADDVIRITVTFSEAVTVDTAGGTPRWPYSIIGGDRFSQSARYAGKAGPARLVFESTVPANPNVQVPDMSVGHNVSLRGGAIRDALGNAHVEGTQPGIALVGPAVDGSRQGGADRVGPLMRGLAFAGAAPHDVDGDGAPDSYGVRDAIEVAVTFNEAVAVDTSGGAPWLGLQVGTVERQAAYASGTGTATLVFSYAVAAGDEDLDGVSVPAGSITLGGGTLADASGNAAALAHDALAPDAARRVDGTPAAVTGLAFAGVAPRDANGDGTPDTYRRGDAIEVAVTFSEAVTVTGTPSLTLDVGGESRALYTAGSGTRTLVFFHAVAEDDVDADGVSVPAGSISLRGGNIADAAGNAATLTHGALATDPARKVDGTIVPPAPYHIAFVGRAPHDADRRGGGDTYGTGDAIEVAVSFTRQVRVDTTGGVPSITLQVGKRDRVAAYVSIRDQYVLTFRYTVAAGDADTDGVSVRAGRIALNGATLAAVFGPTPALAHRRLVANPWRRVDAVAPTLEGIAMNDAPQEHEGHRTFFAGDVIRLTATFSEPVFVTGTPRVGLAIGAQSVNRHAEYVGMAGPSAPVFQYTVAAGDADADGLVTGGAVLVAGATVADAVGNAYLAAAAEGVAHRQRVDGSRSGSDNVGPVVQGLAFAGAAPYDARQQRHAGDLPYGRRDRGGGDVQRGGDGGYQRRHADARPGGGECRAAGGLRVGHRDGDAHLRLHGGAGGRGSQRSDGAAGEHRGERGNARRRGGQRGDACARRHHGGLGPQGRRRVDAGGGDGDRVHRRRAARRGPRRHARDLRVGQRHQGGGDVLRGSDGGHQRRGAVGRRPSGRRDRAGGVRVGNGDGNDRVRLPGGRGRRGYGRGFGAGG